MITVNRSVMTLSKSVITANKLVMMTLPGSVGIKVDVENKFPPTSSPRSQLVAMWQQKDEFESGLMT